MRNACAQKYGCNMQLTRAADYGVRALIHLAGAPAGERWILSHLSGLTEVPVSFLSKVLQKLCRAGFVDSVRGQWGGFAILPAGRAATIASVIEAIEGPLQLNACLAPGASCSRKTLCPAHGEWVQAQAAMIKALQARTISDLAAQAASPVKHSIQSEPVQPERMRIIN